MAYVSPSTQAYSSRKSARAHHPSHSPKISPSCQGNRLPPPSAECDSNLSPGYCVRVPQRISVDELPSSGPRCAECDHGLRQGCFRQCGSISLGGLPRPSLGRRRQGIAGLACPSNGRSRLTHKWLVSRDLLLPSLHRL